MEDDSKDSNETVEEEEVEDEEGEVVKELEELFNNWKFTKNYQWSEFVKSSYFTLTNYSELSI